jgi:F-type H+-transporting ATPase subunit a
MEEHKFLIVGWINDFIRWIVGFFGVHIPEGREIFPIHIVMAVIVTIVLIVFFKLAVKRLSVKEPGKMQYFLEVLYKFFQDLVDDMIGHEGRRFIPVLATLGLFIATSNMIGLIPEMGSPTANLNITAGARYL